MSDSMFKIAILDDDEIFAESLHECLGEYSPDFYTSSTEGLSAIESLRYDILILDYYIDELTGADVVKRIREFDKDIYIILLTGFSEEVPGVQSLRSLEIQDYCEKNARNFNNILIRIESAIKTVAHLKTLRKSPNFHDRLKFLRESNNELQLELANKLSVSRQAIGSYESGRSEPSYDLLKKIAAHYKVSID